MAAEKLLSLESAKASLDGLKQRIKVDMEVKSDLEKELETEQETLEREKEGTTINCN